MTEARAGAVSRRPMRHERPIIDEAGLDAARHADRLLSAARAFIRSNRFGDLVAVQGSAIFRKPDHYFDEGPWRSQVGGGPS